MWFSDRLMGFFLTNFLHKIYGIYKKLVVKVGLSLSVQAVRFVRKSFSSSSESLFLWFVSLRLVANSFPRDLADWLTSQICDFLIGFIGLH